MHRVMHRVMHHATNFVSAGEQQAAIYVYVEQRDSDDGSALEVTADMDHDTHRMFVGRRWT